MGRRAFEHSAPVARSDRRHGDYPRPCRAGDQPNQRWKRPELTNGFTSASTSAGDRSFIPAYLAASGLAFLQGRDPYHDNHFEREAFAHA